MSTFMFYVIKRLLDKKASNQYTATDVTVTIGKSSYQLDNDGLLCRFDRTVARKYVLSGKSTIHLIDPDTTTSMLIEEEKSFAVFFASPPHSNIEPYQPRKMLKLYMPTWDKEELMECCKCLRVSEDEEDEEEEKEEKKWREEEHMGYYKKWGGILLNEINGTCGYEIEMTKNNFPTISNWNVCYIIKSDDRVVSVDNIYTLSYCWP